MRDPHLNPKQWHHGYVGAAIIFFCLCGSFGLLLVVLAWHGDPRALVYVKPVACVFGALIAVGAYLMYDDIRQHRRQHTHPGYRSPVNKLWGWILRKVGR